jgi:GDP-L-fucose synthase
MLTLNDLQNAKVLVTGGTGFLGRHLCKALEGVGARPLPLGRDCDLTDSRNADAIIGQQWDFVFHVAGHNGGILYNQTYPADIFHRNSVMGLNLLEACKKHGVKKVVSIVASCAYPWYDDRRDCAREILQEDDFLRGEPHATVACHGYAKRNLQLASAFYRRQYGLNAVCACPTTLYGPGDSFDPARTKVMGAVIKKFVDAHDGGDPEVVCWGTGAAYREFLYVEDAARLLIETLLRYGEPRHGKPAQFDSESPLNLGSGQELSIKQLSETVGRVVDFKGAVRWDTTKSDGQLRKRLDLAKMREVLPEFRYTPLEEGIRKTVDYYRWTRLKAAA